MHSPNGNYTGMPPEYKIGSIQATVTGDDGATTEITAEGLTIWGVAFSANDN
eukprot:CAMPEP_0171891980 /NCGR_PEP_ID=MMETSP0992-20121227/45054_1 /TAXON_ID=483369 /ORGANISM="non described non described, Strain CCMP2098" /LENGTH=51 /DNA_ID=CAMNT_0012519403 /DNA_START=130 /DNA_END=285 /DNA_ORIENTATION=+